MRVSIVMRMAQQALRRNVLRSALTMLGVIIGVAAVIAMLAIGQGAQAVIQAQIASLGANLLTVWPGSTSQSGVRYGGGTRTNLRVADVDAIRQECTAVAFVSPSVRTNAQVVNANQNWVTRIEGTGVDYPLMREWPLVAGQWFTEQDVDGVAKVAVLGETVRTMLFGDADPVGQVIQIKNRPFKIVGVLAPKGQSAWGQDQDDVIFIPYSTAQRRVIGTRYVHSILVAAHSRVEIPTAIDQISVLLRQRHRLTPGQDDDFSIRALADIAATEAESSRVMTTLLGSIASISLLVGGIGIMNIMLVSVSERTREIGIRIAVGARQRDIRWQFLTEALALSLIGGALGVALGIGSSHLLTTTAGWPSLISWDAVVLAFTFAAAVGLFFGLYPAHRAAQLDPIQALRYE